MSNNRYATMVWVERHFRVFQAIAAASAIFAAGIVLWFNVPQSRSATITHLQAGVLALPWLIGILAFLPVLYISWSRHAQSTASLLISRVMLVLFSIAVLAIFAGIYGHFVFALF